MAIKVLKINVETKQVEETTIETWKDIAPMIGNGCSLFTIPVTFENEDAIHCDDEGLFNDIKGGFMMDGWSYPLVGNAVVIGTNMKTGNMVNVKTDRNVLAGQIQWVDQAKCEAWAEQFR